MAANQLVRAMMLLMRSFDEAKDPELKLLFTKIAQGVIELMQENVANAALRDSALLFFHKMIITLGAEVLGQLKIAVNIVLPSLDLVSFAHIVKMTHLTLQVLRHSAVDFVREIFPFLLSSAVNMGQPTSVVSDLEKTHLDAVRTFMKLIKLISQNNVEMFYQLDAGDKFTMLLAFITTTVQSPVDEIRRTGVALMVAILAASLGLQINADRVVSPPKPVRACAVQPEYSAHAGILLTRALDCAFSPLGALSPAKNPVDSQCVQDLALLHVLLYRSAADQFAERFQAWINEGNQAVEAGIKQGLEAAGKTGSVREYKEMLKQTVIAAAKARTG